MMQLEIIILSEVFQKGKCKYHDITYMWNLKYGTNRPIDKTEIDSQTQRSDLWLPRGSGRERRQYTRVKSVLHFHLKFSVIYLSTFSWAHFSNWHSQ